MNKAQEKVAREPRNKQRIKTVRGRSAPVKTPRQQQWRRRQSEAKIGVTVNLQGVHWHQSEVSLSCLVA